MAIIVQLGGVGANVLPHAIKFAIGSTNTTITTSEFDGTLKAGQEYRIAVTAPDGPEGIYTATYSGVEGLTYTFDNIH